MIRTLVALSVLAAAIPASPQTPAAAPAANAPMPELIEDFFLSEAVRSESRGELQVTAAGQAFRHNGSAAALDLEYGLTNRLQLSAELPYGFHTTPQADTPATWSSLNTGVQYQFLRSTHPFALTAGVSTSIPLTDRGEFEIEPAILAAKTFGPTQLHASFEAGLGGDNREYAYNLASVTDLHNRWNPTLEFNGRRNQFGNAFYITPGIYRHFPNRLEAGIAVAAGTWTGVLVKITWELGDTDD